MIKITIILFSIIIWLLPSFVCLNCEPGDPARNPCQVVQLFGQVQNYTK